MTFEDKQFLANPDQWPSTAEGFPYCCLKRKPNPDANYEHGFIVGVSQPLVLNLGFVFDGGNGQIIEYDSVDDLLKAGWLVD